MPNRSITAEQRRIITVEFALGSTAAAVATRSGVSLRTVQRYRRSVVAPILCKACQAENDGLMTTVECFHAGQWAVQLVFVSGVWEVHGPFTGGELAENRHEEIHDDLLSAATRFDTIARFMSSDRALRLLDLDLALHHRGG